MKSFVWISPTARNASIDAGFVKTMASFEKRDRHGDVSWRIDPFALARDAGDSVEAGAGSGLERLLFHYSMPFSVLQVISVQRLEVRR